MTSLNRAYSVLEIKAFDDEKREITGIATTPEPDRVGDIVEPMGAKFKNPLPLLWQHQHDKPVGTVKFDKPTDKGITFTASLPIIEEAGPLKDMVDLAWQSVKAKLVRGVSIGFRALDDGYELMKTGGVRFLKTEVIELSLVTIPANASATIQTIKSLDTATRAASGAGGSEDLPGVSGKTKGASRAVSLNLKPKENTMNVQEQLKAARAKKLDLQEKMSGLMTKAADAGETLDEAQAQEFDGYDAEMKGVDAHISRLETMEKSMLSTATVAKGGEQAEASASRAPAIVTASNINIKQEPGVMFARHALCMLAAKNNVAVAAQLAHDNYGAKSPVAQVLKALGGRSLEAMLAQKATVAAATTTDATWAGPLLAYNTYTQDFVEFLRPRTILGQFGTGNIPAAKRIPFNVHIKGQTSGGVGYWVGQGAPKPVTKFDYNDVYFGFFKVAAIAVATDEMIRFSDPAIEVLIRDGLAEAGAERMNTDFINPAFAGAANISPASILNGITPIPSSGTDADAVRADLLALQAAADDANNPLDSMVYIMNPRTAAALGNMFNPLGQREFPTISRRGGDLGGVPVITSGYVPYDSDGGIVAMVNASDLWYADDGQATVDMSNQASIQMLDNPTNNSATGTATAMVSMFQSDSTAFRMHRFANWARRRASSFAYLTGVNWAA